MEKKYEKKNKVLQISALSVIIVVVGAAVVYSLVIPNKLDYTQKELKDLYLKYNITENDIKFAQGELPNFLEGKRMKGDTSEMRAIEEEARNEYIKKYGVDPGNPKLDEVHGILIPVGEVKRLVKIGRLVPSE